MADLLAAPAGMRCIWSDGTVRPVVCLTRGGRGVEPVVVVGDRLLPPLGDFLIRLGEEPDPTPDDFDMREEDT